jgi:excisionase family DNA binding protein
MTNHLSSEFLTTRELAELLRIKERKVYELAASGDVPCSRATGKLLFPRQAVEAWIMRNSSGLRVGTDAGRAQVFAGSHDPLLEWALRESRAGLATYFDGSLDGVERFANLGALAAGMHVYNPADGGWNEHLVERRFGRNPVVLVEFAWRARGLLVASGKQAAFLGIASLRGRRVVPRQPEAGSQALLEHLLEAEGLTPDDLELTALARTETDAALAVAEGKADAAFGLRGLAGQFRLGFVPLIRERFDLLVERRSWFEPPMQRFSEFCRSEAFRQKAEDLSGYEVSGFGRVHFNGP